MNTYSLSKSWQTGPFDADIWNIIFISFWKQSCLCGEKVYLSSCIHTVIAYCHPSSRLITLQEKVLINHLQYLTSALWGGNLKPTFGSFFLVSGVLESRMKCDWVVPVTALNCYLPLALNLGFPCLNLTPDYLSLNRFFFSSLLFLYAIYIVGNLTFLMNPYDGC